MKQSDLFDFLAKIGRRPNRRLSQNFLIDSNIVHKILRAAEISSKDYVLEIGPGPGALTQALLEEGATVFAIEKDTVLAEQLNRFQTPDYRLTTFCEDILDFDFSAHFPQNLQQEGLENRKFSKEASQIFDPEEGAALKNTTHSNDEKFEKNPTLQKTATTTGMSQDKKLKVVANLPYHITTPILERLFAFRDLFSSFTIMVQTEMAERMLAVGKSKNVSSLSLFVQFHTTAKTSFSVPASCFYPKPKVGSTVLRLDVKKPPLPTVESSDFFTLVRRAFQQRRKVLRKSVQDLYPPEIVKCALSQLGMNLEIRPEELSLEQWIAFFKELKKA